MAGLGWSGSYGATGAADALEKILKDQENKKQLAFENQLKTRAADLADRRESEVHADRMDANAWRSSQAKQAQDNHEEASTLARREMDMSGNFMADTDPQAPLYKKYVGSLQDAVPAVPAMGPDFQGPSQNDLSPQQAILGRVPGNIMRPTQKQHTTDENAQLRETIAANTDAYRNRQADIGDRRAATGEVNAVTGQTVAQTGRINATTAQQRANTGDVNAATGQGRLRETIRNDDMRNTTAQAGQGARAGVQSYNHESAQLDAISKPLGLYMDRLSRLKQSLDAGTAVADSVVIPEFVIAMAGGQGSGLRINNAEIDRTQGARSVWTSLSAKLSQWDPNNPGKVLNIQPIERKAMYDLLNVVHAKGVKRLEIIRQAQQDLINNPSDATAQRTIALQAKTSLDALDNPPTPQAPGRPSAFGAAPAQRPGIAPGPGQNRDSVMFGGTAAPAPATPAAQPPGAGTGRAPTNPAVGDFFTFPNGNRGRWDGTGWELVQ